jgi:hypothetical protein
MMRLGWTERNSVGEGNLPSIQNIVKKVVSPVKATSLE